MICASSGDTTRSDRYKEIVSWGVIVLVALAAITAFALCFVNSPYMPKNYFNGLF